MEEEQTPRKIPRVKGGTPLKDLCCTFLEEGWTLASDLSLKNELTLTLVFYLIYLIFSP